MRKLFIIFFIIFFLANNVFAQDVYSQYIPREDETVFAQSVYKIDVTDPIASTNSKGINYPGLRGANQLVVYTPEFGFRTNTNEFGTEAIICDGIVTSLSGADSLIPMNGLVVSGHGQAKKWINEHLMIGAKIFIDKENGTITSYITSDTFMYSAKEKIKEVQGMIDYYSACCTNYNSKRTEDFLEKSKDYVLKAEKYPENSQKYSAKAISFANSAMFNAIPYKEKETKGVWIRPTYFSRGEIEDVLDRLSDAGINNIYLETFYHGQTIFPSKVMEKYGFIRQYEDYIGFDPLKIWITEAHKRDIKVNIWFQTFYVGNKPPEANPRYILAVRPEWANYQKKYANSEEIMYSVSEHNGYFIDPANPDVQTFLYELLCEIIQRYRPDGINLDYIRYPQSVSSNYTNYDMSNWGYTMYARQEFQALYNIDPIELQKDSPLWQCWTAYRCNKITTFVKKVSGLCRANNITLTAVIFPNRTAALDTKLQDWRTWSINNFVDGFTPLFLTCDDKTTANLTEEVLRNKSSSTKLYAGLFATFMNGSESDLIKQIHVTRKYNLDGVILFDYAHLNQNYIDTLTESVFKPLKTPIVINDNYANEINKKLNGKKKRGTRG